VDDLVSLLLVFVASGLLHGAAPERQPAAMRKLMSVRWPLVARAGAAALVTLATVRWHRVEPGPAAFLQGLVALLASLTVLALAVPRWPRAAWRAVVVGGAVALVLAVVIHA
jgi:hypothetical protein